MHGNDKTELTKRFSAYRCRIQFGNTYPISVFAEGEVCVYVCVVEQPLCKVLSVCLDFRTLYVM